MKLCAAFLLCLLICFLLYRCNKAPESLRESLRLEGRSDNWTVLTNIPYTLENDDKYIKVTFICNTVNNLFSEGNNISFSIGTSVGSVVYTYSEIDGYIRSEYSSDSIDLERINRVFDDTFEVLWDIDIIDINSLKVSEPLIVIQVNNEQIELKPVE